MLPKRESDPDDPFTENTMLGETTGKWVGRILIKLINKQVSKMIGESNGNDVDSAERMMEAVVREMPVRAFGMMGGDMVPKYFTEGVVSLLNGKTLKGIGLLLKRK